MGTKREMRKAAAKILRELTEEDHKQVADFVGGLKGKWLTNLSDPRRADAKRYIITRTHETPEEAWRHQEEWLADKVIGEPKAAEAYTVEQLKEMKTVGIYTK